MFQDEREDMGGKIAYIPFFHFYFQVGHAQDSSISSLECMQLRSSVMLMASVVYDLVAYVFGCFPCSHIKNITVKSVPVINWETHP